MSDLPIISQEIHESSWEVFLDICDLLNPGLGNMITGLAAAFGVAGTGFGLFYKFSYKPFQKSHEKLVVAVDKQKKEFQFDMKEVRHENQTRMKEAFEQLRKNQELYFKMQQQQIEKIEKLMDGLGTNAKNEMHDFRKDLGKMNEKMHNFEMLAAKANVDHFRTGNIQRGNSMIQWLKLVEPKLLEDMCQSEMKVLLPKQHVDDILSDSTQFFAKFEALYELIKSGKADMESLVKVATECHNSGKLWVPKVMKLLKK